MSEQSSGTHGPFHDDAIKRRDQAEARQYADEWPAPEEEPADQADQGATWAPAARLAESPASTNWTAVELRSDLARHLDRTVWPVARERLVEVLTEHGAGDRLVELAASLPGGQRYESLPELVHALGLDPGEHGR